MNEEMLAVLNELWYVAVTFIPTVMLVLVVWEVADVVDRRRKAKEKKP